MIIDPNVAFWAFLVVAVVWVVQFAQFMVLDDASFPGRWDKLIWGAAFILAFPIAPFAFLVWKKAYRQYVESVRAEKGGRIGMGEGRLFGGEQ